MGYGVWRLISAQMGLDFGRLFMIREVLVNVYAMACPNHAYTAAYPLRLCYLPCYNA